MTFPERPVPKRITPCPIAESIIEIRFDSDIPREAVFGVLFDQLKSKYPETIRLPISQLPGPVLEGEPDFKFKPHYRLGAGDKKSCVQIGPQVISLATKGDYPGWTSYSKQFRELLDVVAGTSVIKTVHRLGIRYINFFVGENIFEKIDLNLRMGTNPFESAELSIRTSVQHRGFVNLLQISNNAKWKVDKTEKKGSALDIDTIRNAPLTLKEISDSILESGHSVEKQIFFGLMKEEVIKKDFKPEYK